MDEPKTTKDWHQLELDATRLFSAAPLSPGRSRANGYEESLFAGRGPEAHRLMEAVRDPAKHILLYGERGLGKTSISNNFWINHSRNDQNILVARVQAYPSDDFSSLWLRVLEEFEAVSRQYRQELQADFNHVSPDIIKREFRKLHRSLTSIIIIDEFDQLRATEARESTANLLKSLHDDAVNVTILLIGVADNVEELITDHRSLRRVLSLIKLERMSAIDLNEILDRRLRSTPLTVADDARSAIVGLSCGVPYYVQTLGKFAAQNAIRAQRLRVRVADVDAAITKFIVESGESFAEPYRKATQSRQAGNAFQEVILASALARSDASGFFRPSDVADVLDHTGSGKIWSYPRVQQYLSQFASDRRGNILIRRGIGSAYQYRFSDATMQPFIIMKAIKDQPIDGVLGYFLLHWDKEGSRNACFRLAVAEASVGQRGVSEHEDSAPRPSSTDLGKLQTEAIITSPVPPACGLGPAIEGIIIPTATTGAGGAAPEPAEREPVPEPSLKSLFDRLFG